MRSQYKARYGETNEDTKNLKENKFPRRDKRRAQRFSNEEEIFNLIDD